MNLPRILCVDDSPALLTSLGLGFERHGFEVVTAVDGLDALIQFKAHSGKFNAIITDNDMPRMNGLDLVRSVLTEGFTGPIVVMSGHFTLEQLRDYRSHPISHFVHKPFEVGSIVATILKKLSPAQAGKNTESLSYSSGE